jgi:hypothetical protein
VSDNLAFDSQGIQQGLAQLGNLPADVKAFRANLKSNLEQAGTIQTRAGTDLDLGIYQVNDSCEKVTDGVLGGVEEMFGWLTESTHGATGVLGNVEDNASSTSSGAFEGGGGHHG